MLSLAYLYCNVACEVGRWPLRYYQPFYSLFNGVKEEYMHPRRVLNNQIYMVSDTLLV